MMYFDTNKNQAIARPNWFFDGGVPVSDDYLAENGIFPLVDVRPTDTALYTYYRGGYVVTDGAATVDYVQVARALEDAKSWLKGVVTTRRYDHETKGVTINGAQIESTRDSQAMISGAVLFAKENADATINFKAATGWVSIPAADMIEIGKAVGAHVQACFTKERELHEVIDAATDLAGLEAIGIEDGWPGSG